MSASTERKTRREAIAAGTDRKTKAAAEEQTRRAKSRRNTAIVCVVLAIVLIFTIVGNSTLLYRNTTALTIGDSKYSPAEVSYQYAAQYFNFMTYYGSYASYFGLDTTYGISGLASQEYADGQTWKDYFLDSAIENMTQMKAYIDYANANGITLSDDDLAEIEESVSQLDEYASENGYSSANKLLSANYGKGVNVDTVRQAYKDMQLAELGKEALDATYEYTDKELDEYYDSLDGSYDRFTYAYYYVQAEQVDSTDADGNTTSAATEETLAAATAKCDLIVSTTEETNSGDPLTDFQTAVMLIAGDGEEPTENTAVTGSSLSSLYADWLKDSSRKAGDVSTFESTAGSYVVMFLDYSDNSYNTVSVRHILIKAEADENGEYTEEALAAAKEKAESIYAEWQNGEKTEDSFAALANEYSEDDGSNTTGGLYEDIYKNEMVSEFDAFCFAGHKPGDTGIVYGESTSYAGYHIIYFVGEGEMYSRVLAKSDLVSEADSAWLEEAEAGLEVSRKWAMKFVG